MLSYPTVCFSRQFMYLSYLLCFATGQMVAILKSEPEPAQPTLLLFYYYTFSTAILFF